MMGPEMGHALLPSDAAGRFLGCKQHPQRSWQGEVSSFYCSTAAAGSNMQLSGPFPCSCVLRTGISWFISASLRQTPQNCFCSAEGALGLGCCQGEQGLSSRSPVAWGHRGAVGRDSSALRGFSPSLLPGPAHTRCATAESPDQELPGFPFVSPAALAKAVAWWSVSRWV